MISRKTGVEIEYIVESYDYSGVGQDREIAGWRLVPTKESIAKHPKCAGTKVLIIND